MSHFGFALAVVVGTLLSLAVDKFIIKRSNVGATLVVGALMLIGVFVFWLVRGEA